MWETLYTFCSQVGEKVDYSILQELLNYAQNKRSKGFQKLVRSIFVDIHFLIKGL